MMKAKYYKKLKNNVVQCLLCPHLCNLIDGAVGSCKVRMNREGVLYSENYAVTSAVRFDPIEKKPLYHFYPSYEIFSIGSFGCNLHCSFCQNAEISQIGMTESAEKQTITPQEVVKLALQNDKNIGIAFTYNEPIIWYEYVLSTSKLAQKAGLKTVMVSNGFINEEPLAELLPFIDAFNIDLKAFSAKFYQQITKSQIEPVKRTLKQIVEAGKHLEITNLVIPVLNDKVEDFEEMVKWIKTELGEDTVLHLARYYPRYKLTINPTSAQTMEQLWNVAKKYLNYVYLGNLESSLGQSTFCKKCGTEVISRSGYKTNAYGLTAMGNCYGCREMILQNYSK